MNRKQIRAQLKLLATEYKGVAEEAENLRDTAASRCDTYEFHYWKGRAEVWVNVHQDIKALLKESRKPCKRCT